MAEILSAAQLKRLSEHKYSAQGTSFTEPVMQKFWRWLVEQIPLWWAPNAITLVGLMLNVVTTVILIMYSPNGQEEAPQWCYLSCGIGLFLYQALDAIDGKQARRTGSSSPLGELFDHGCDALSIVFVVIGTCISIRIGNMPTLFFIECFATIFLFYVAHWQTYCTGTLKFGWFDVTEAQFGVMFAYLVSGLFGASVWDIQIPLIGLQLNIFPILVSLTAFANSMKLYFSIIFYEGGIGKNGSTVAGTSVLSPIVPSGILFLMAVAIWKMSTTNIYENHPVLYILSFGMAQSKITNKLVVAHMTKSEMDLFDSSLIGPGLLIANQYFNTPLNEYIVLWMCFVYCSLDLLRYSIGVCREICDYLNIYCFKITPPKKVKSMEHSRQSSNGTEGLRSGEYTKPVTRSAAKSKD